MVEGLLITDDLTGANASGILLKKLGIPTSTVLDRSYYSRKADVSSRVIAFSTDSRGLPKSEAYSRVFDAVTFFADPAVCLYNKRIDSTLRGNIGAEIDAMLDALKADDRLAVMVPSYPAAGRVAVGGYLLVNGDLLERSDAALDSKMPIGTSIIEDIVKKQSSRQIKTVPIGELRHQVETIRENIKGWYREGIRILIFNALTNGDLQVIAKAVLESDVPFITVDPGPFTAAMAGEIFLSGKKESYGKILMIIGSVTDTTTKQLEELTHVYPVIVISVKKDQLLLGDSKRELEVNRIVSCVKESLASGSIFCITTNNPNSGKYIDLNALSHKSNSSCEDLSQMINTGLGEIAGRLIAEIPDFHSLFCSGGDTTRAVADSLKASVLSLEQEVIPLAAYGTLEGGIASGIKIITKGGMVGDKNAMKICIEFLMRQI